MGMYCIGTHPTLRITCFLFAVIFLMISSGQSYSANSGIGFSGTVPERQDNLVVQKHAKVIVSFGNQAALPIGGLGNAGSPVRVYDESRKLVTGSYTHHHNGMGNVQIVPLNRNGLQQFDVCESKEVACIRFSVLREQ